MKRDGMHLVTKQDITVLEALTGFTLRIPHLDNRTLLVHSDPNIVYRPGDLKCVRDQGFPQHNNPYQRGHLFIQLNLVFPPNGSISEKAKKTLATVLPAAERKEGDAATASTPAGAADKKPKKKKPSTDEDMTDDAANGENDEPVTEEVALVDVDVEEERARQSEQQKESYEEDEERGQRGPGCRAQ